MLNTWLATEILAFRGWPVPFEATVKLTVALPVPEPGGETVTQGAVLVAVQVQAVVMLKLPDPPVVARVACGGAMLYEQLAPSCEI
jgi:hypothetical protein